MVDYRSDIDKPLVLSELISTVNSDLDKLTKNQLEDQITILQHFVHYKNISEDLGNLVMSFNIDSQRLPKNMSDTFNKEYLLDKIFNNDLPIIKNTDRLNKFVTYSFNQIPSLVSEIFSSGKNNVVPYNLPAYIETYRRIAALTRKERYHLSTDQVNEINREIKKFIYTSPQIQDRILRNESYEQFKERVFNTESETLVERLINLKERDNVNLLVQKLSIEVSKSDGANYLLLNLHLCLYLYQYQCQCQYCQHHCYCH